MYALGHPARTFTTPAPTRASSRTTSKSRVAMNSPGLIGGDRRRSLRNSQSTDGTTMSAPVAFAKYHVTKISEGAASVVSKAHIAVVPIPALTVAGSATTRPRKIMVVRGLASGSSLTSRLMA